MRFDNISHSQNTKGILRINGFPDLFKCQQQRVFRARLCEPMFARLSLTRSKCYTAWARLAPRLATHLSSVIGIVKSLGTVE